MPNRPQGGENRLLIVSCDVAKVLGSKRLRIGSVFCREAGGLFDLQAQRGKIVICQIVVQGDPPQGVLLPKRPVAGPVE